MKDGYMLPVASINSVYIDDAMVRDLFRLDLILQDCIDNKDLLEIENVYYHKDVFDGFQSALMSDNEEVKSIALSIGHKYGARLSQIIKTLKRPSELSKKNRNNWTEEHWNYWKTIKKVIFVGGVSIPGLIKIFLEDIKEMLREEKIDLEISFIEGSINLGTEALSKKVVDSEALLFDFGQTNIKRRHHLKDGEDVVFDMILPCMHSKYLFYKKQSDEELMKTAKKLDQYIQSVILKTIEETMFEGDKILLAIANYIYQGRIYPSRGGYAKLGLLGENYEVYLTECLSRKIGYHLDVTLIHDTTAVSYFFEEEVNTAVISIGTAFGVSFVEGKTNG